MYCFTSLFCTAPKSRSRMSARAPVQEEDPVVVATLFEDELSQVAKEEVVVVVVAAEATLVTADEEASVTSVPGGETGACFCFSPVAEALLDF